MRARSRRCASVHAAAPQKSGATPRLPLLPLSLCLLLSLCLPAACLPAARRCLSALVQQQLRGATRARVAGVDDFFASLLDALTPLANAAPPSALSSRAASPRADWRAANAAPYADDDHEDGRTDGRTVEHEELRGYDDYCAPASPVPPPPPPPADDVDDEYEELGGAAAGCAQEPRSPAQATTGQFADALSPTVLMLTSPSYVPF